MKVSVRAEHILSPSLQPLAVGRATELCPALPETFLSLQGDLTSPLSRLVYLINSLENWFGKIAPLLSNTALVKVIFSKKDVISILT